MIAPPLSPNHNHFMLKTVIPHHCAELGQAPVKPCRQLFHSLDALLVAGWCETLRDKTVVIVEEVKRGSWGFSGKCCELED